MQHVEAIGKLDRHRPSVTSRVCSFSLMATHPAYVRAQVTCHYMQVAKIMSLGRVIPHSQDPSNPRNPELIPCPAAICSAAGEHHAQASFDPRISHCHRERH